MKPFLRQDSQEMLQEQHTITYSIEPVNIIVQHRDVWEHNRCCVTRE